MFVGFVITSDGNNGPWIKVLSQKIRKLKRAIVQLLHHGQCVTAHAVMRVVGQCVAMSKAIVPGELLLRNVYCVIASRTNWDSVVSFSDAAIKDLHWWLVAFQSWNGAPLHYKPVDLQVTMDASAAGWGAAISDLSCATLTLQAAG